MTLIESEQSKDTRLTQIARGPFFLRFASYRKGEDAGLGLRSEDYIVSELTPDQAIFGLCDGVGSSYYGNIGSQILGETILNWLGNVHLPNKSDLMEELSATSWLKSLNDELKMELDSKIDFATTIIQTRKNTSKGELVDLAEKTQRDDFGTQSNFAGGIIWPRSSDLPNGLVLLFWLGNARIRIFNGTEDLTPLTKWGSNPEQLKEVWSSKEGVVGQIYSYLTDFSKITTVIAYSDGMEGVEEGIKPDIAGGILETLIQRAQSIKDDDVSYLEIFLAQDGVDEYTDDVVPAIRNHYNSNDSSITAELQAKVQELKNDLQIAIKQNNEQALELQKIKKRLRLFTAISAISVILALIFCLLSGYFFMGTTVVDLTPTITNTPTLTLIPLPATSTVTATETTTETATTGVPTASSTLTSTETATPEASTTTLTSTITLIPGLTIVP